MEKNTRKSIMENMKVFSPGCGEHDYIEVTEWANGEGWDITIEYASEVKRFSLHWDELDALKHLIGELNFYFKDDNTNNGSKSNI